jgi:diguanylate cyclase (GGDEF)-like protein
VREQTSGVLFSAATYVLYGVIGCVQSAFGLLSWSTAALLIALGLFANGVFYALVRSGRTARSVDPGLRKTQLLFGVLMMFPTYMVLGPAASGLLVVMASHVVYAMFTMTPRQVWQLVTFILGGLAATMLACHALWPGRYAPAVQLSSMLYALLVLPLIAVLAHRITGMTQRLRQQHTDLQSALARLQELATRDELTHTHNRRHMAELLDTQQALHRRLGQPLALALLDLDHFKQVNDRLGHAAGDAVLRGFARVAQTQLRAVDLLGRWGGEEFLVLMPATTTDDALAALQRLQQALADRAGDVMPQALRITFSGGVTLLAPDEPPGAAIERADRLMYSAKTAGRARCLVERMPG